MNYPNPPSERNKGLSVWLDRHSSAANANRIIAGRGVRARRTTKGIIIDALPKSRATTFFHPFKIYPATLKDGDDKDRPWRYWSVRGGYIGYRSATGGGDGLNVNHENQAVLVANGADGCVDNIANQVYDWHSSNTTPDPLLTVEDVAVGNSGAFTVSDPAHVGRFVLDPTPDNKNCVAAVFWAEARVPSGGTAGDFREWVIKCQMFTEDAGTTGRAAYPAIREPYQVQIGDVEPPDGMFTNIGSPPSSLFAQQFVHDHVINRFPPGYGRDFSGGGDGVIVLGGMTCLMFRGVWDALDSTGLTGQFFYESDFVTVPVDGQVIPVDGGGGGSVTLPDMYNAYLRIAPGIGTKPPGANWQLIAGFWP